MELVTGFRNIAIPIRPAQGIRDLKKAGFNNILLDLSEYCRMEVLWPGKEKVSKAAMNNPEALRAGYATFLQVCKEIQMQLPIAQLPYLDSTKKRDDLADKQLDILEECVASCEEAGCRYVIARPLFAGVARGQEWNVNKEYYLKLDALCKDKHTKILLANQCRNVSGHLIRGNCAEAEEAVQWIDELNAMVGKERFAFCMDTGICNLCAQDMRELVTTLGKRLKVVILRDNDGQSDDSLLPFTAVDNKGVSTDWLSLIRGLRDMGFDGYLIEDYAQTAGAFSPLLKPTLLTLAYQTADFFKWQIELENLMKKYEHIVLFGAGNMCRNYMKNYGKKYPPLFTCDNSSARWGEEFCGLEIKSPKALLDLPENTGIFICNMYYREIEKQLNDMGIVNVEFFNDEYMPSFHMDGLELR